MSPDTVRRLAQDFGADRLVAALDVRIDEDGTALAAYPWLDQEGRSEITLAASGFLLGQGAANTCCAPTSAGMAR